MLKSYYCFGNVAIKVHQISRSSDGFVVTEKVFNNVQQTTVELTLFYVVPGFHNDHEFSALSQFRFMSNIFI